MMKRESLLKDVVRAIGMIAIAVMLVVIPRVARAHAVLVQSNPAANSTVHGPELTIALKFNSRVDAARSVLSLVRESGDTAASAPQSLPMDKQPAPNALVSHAGNLSPGKYVIRWQALAIDGHITRGEIPFQVQ